MKTVFVLAFVVALALTAPLGDSNDNIYVDGYKFSFESSDGQSDQEKARQRRFADDVEALVVRGSYTFTSSDGQVYTFNYVADKNGFQPEAAHLPTRQEEIPPHRRFEGLEHQSLGNMWKRSVTIQDAILIPVEGDPTSTSSVGATLSQSLRPPSTARHDPGTPDVRRECVVRGHPGHLRYDTSTRHLDGIPAKVRAEDPFPETQHPCKYHDQSPFVPGDSSLSFNGMFVVSGVTRRN
ncbi:uncharacterized protein LOC129752249 [Uranotaenia lowii]|uniref:uncharacterized protein LOC129752249 n=1 Tax=Uranotaenia lowii TaxID=190385 RepID=UPI00247A29A8|nr:uncharacterized protein LOC129752249 [Uranotaenia lowii]